MLQIYTWASSTCFNYGIYIALHLQDISLNTPHDTHSKATKVAIWMSDCKMANWFHTFKHHIPHLTFIPSHIHSQWSIHSTMEMCCKTKPTCWQFQTLQRSDQTGTFIRSDWNIYQITNFTIRSSLPSRIPYFNPAPSFKKPSPGLNQYQQAGSPTGRWLMG